MSTQSTDRSAERQTNRFELTGHSHSGAGNIETALARNRAFAAAGGHKNAVVFPNLRLCVITCLDPLSTLRTFSASSAAHGFAPPAPR